MNVTVELVNKTAPVVDKLVNKTAPFVGNLINDTRQILKGLSESSSLLSSMNTGYSSAGIPQFLSALGINAQREYWNIMDNKNLTKAQIQNNLLAWANRTGTYVSKNLCYNNHQ